MGRADLAARTPALAAVDVMQIRFLRPTKLSVRATIAIPTVNGRVGNTQFRRCWRSVSTGRDRFQSLAQAFAEGFREHAELPGRCSPCNSSLYAESWPSQEDEAQWELR